MGFPTRDNRDALGPTLENERPVKNPQREIGKDTFNKAWWNMSGANQTVPKVSIGASVSGTTVTVNYQGLAWDPNGDLPNITISYRDVGWYQFAFASSYPDEQGVSQATNLVGGTAISTDNTLYTGTHTGANNQAILTDSTKSFTTDELVGYFIINTTDDSGAEILSNTATTVTGTLIGGAENDWDTGDAYLIIIRDVMGLVQLTSSFGGWIFFTDNDGNKWDPLKFILEIW